MSEELGELVEMKDIEFLSLFQEFGLETPQSSTQVILMLEASEKTGVESAPDDTIAVALEQGQLAETSRGEYVPGEWA